MKAARSCAANALNFAHVRLFELGVSLTLSSFTKGTMMRQVGRTLLTATAFMAASLVSSVSAIALAQGEDVVEAEVVEPDEEWVEEDVEAEEPAEMLQESEAPVEAVTEAAEPEAAPMPAPVADAAPSDGAVLAAPGSTAESDPGGSTRPSTTPDD